MRGIVEYNNSRLRNLYAYNSTGFALRSRVVVQLSSMFSLSFLTVIVQVNCLILVHDLGFRTIEMIV